VPGPIAVSTTTDSRCSGVTAGGWVEMAWHLYKWGNAVEVVAPLELRAMVDAYRRGDFPALP